MQQAPSSEMLAFGSQFADRQRVLEAQRAQLIEEARRHGRDLLSVYPAFCGPPEVHLPREHALEALEAGKPFLCICPLCCLDRVLAARAL